MKGRVSGRWESAAEAPSAKPAGPVRVLGLLSALVLAGGAALYAGRSALLPGAHSAAQSARATFRVRGMSCEHCETTIRTALEKLEGVRTVAVSFKRGEAVVEHDPKKLTPEGLREAIDRLGYQSEIVR